MSGAETTLDSAWDLEIRPIGNGEYRLIPMTGKIDLERSTILIESNVAIDVERFFYGDRLKEVRREAVRDILLLWNRARRPRPPEIFWYGAAVEVSVRPWNGPVDRGLHRRFSFALDKSFRWTTDEVWRMFRQSRDGRPPILGYANEYESASYPYHDSRGLVKLTYVTLLKLVLLRRTQRGKVDDRVGMRLFREWLEWVNNNLKMIPTYETHLALDYLLGPGNSRNEIIDAMKLSGNETTEALQEKVWKYSWDITHIRNVDCHHSLLPPEHSHRRPVLILSADSDVDNLRRRVRVANCASGANALVWRDVNNYPPDFTRFLHEISVQIAEWQQYRSGNSLTLDARINAIDEAALELEAGSTEKSPRMSAFL